MLDIFQSGFQTTIAIIVALGILVGIHEWGHFIVARLCGVKVLKFSIGFGKSIYSWVDKKGTEFVIAWIPLGGFVKMVDEREGEVAKEDLPFAFNRKPASQRIAIVAAGPLINLLFAALVYTFVFMGGQQVLSPVIGSVSEGSIADLAGLKPNEEVLAVDGKSVSSWDEAIHSLVLKVLESGEIQLTVQPVNQLDKTNVRTESSYIRTLVLHEALKIDENTDPLSVLGMQPKYPDIPAVIGDLVADGAGKRDGLQKGDKILSANDELINTWSDWVGLIKAHPEKDMRITLQRGDAVKSLTLRPNAKSDHKGEQYGFVGVGVAEVEWPAHLLKTIELGPIDALVFGFKKTFDSAELILVSTWKLAVGDLARDNLGGPIMIAKLAGRYAEQGIEPYLLFIAYISIVLGVMNLLPIPVLDGGHILFYSIELLIRRPIPEKIQELLMRMGLAILLVIMAFAFYNDLSNIFLGL